MDVNIYSLEYFDFSTFIEKKNSLSLSPFLSFFHLEASTHERFTSGLKDTLARTSDCPFYFETFRILLYILNGIS